MVFDGSRDGGSMVVIQYLQVLFHWRLGAHRKSFATSFVFRLDRTTAFFKKGEYWKIGGGIAFSQKYYTVVPISVTVQ